MAKISPIKKAFCNSTESKKWHAIKEKTLALRRVTMGHVQIANADKINAPKQKAIKKIDKNSKKNKGKDQ